MDITELVQSEKPAALTGLNAGQDLSDSKSRQDQEKMVDVAKKFEGMLVHEMFKQVKQSMETLKDEENEEESSDTCDEQYQSLYWSQMADAVSQQGGIGLYKTFYTQIQQHGDNTGNPGGLLNEGV